MKLLKFEGFASNPKNGVSPVYDELSNITGEFGDEENTVLYDELDMDELLTSFCRDLYQAYLKETGREGRIITSFEEFFFYRILRKGE